MIRFLVLDGKTCDEIKVKLHVRYKDHAHSITVAIKYQMSLDEGQRPYWHCTQHKWTHTKYHTWTIGHEKTIEKICAVFANNGAKITSPTIWEMTTTGQYYTNLFDGFNVKLIKRRPHVTKMWFFTMITHLAHFSLIIIANLVKLHYKVLPHPFYSAELAPCDFFLLPNMKKWLGGEQLSSDKKIVAETKAYFV